MDDKRQVREKNVKGGSLFLSQSLFGSHRNLKTSMCYYLLEQRR